MVLIEKIRWIKAAEQVRKDGENRYKFTKTNSVKKLEREIELIQRIISNMCLNHSCQEKYDPVVIRLGKISN